MTPQPHDPLSQAGPPRPAPPTGTPGNPVQVTDPRMLRALAHPARLAILEFLVIDGPATATECAEVAGLSPSACSYHLRALARYGLVEEDRQNAADGRQRPWRARVVSLSWGADSTTPTAARVAGQVLEERVRAQADELRATYRGRQHDYPLDWQHALGSQLDVLHVTPEELNELREQLVGFFGEHRRLSREQRPPDARRVHVMIDFSPWFTPDSGPGRPPKETS